MWKKFNECEWVDNMSDNKIDFEKSLNELEKIVAQLESGECSLDESIKLFEKGVKCAGDCRNALKDAKSKIMSLTDVEEN